MSDQEEKAAEQDAPPRPPSSCVCGGAGPSLSQLLRAMAPPEAASGHFRQARLEMLKGLRELLDHRIETLAREPDNKGTKFTVE